jgi:predicted type IV restriction endonuclease
MDKFNQAVRGAKGRGKTWDLVTLNSNGRQWIFLSNRRPGTKSVTKSVTSENGPWILERDAAVLKCTSLASKMAGSKVAANAQPLSLQVALKVAFQPSASPNDLTSISCPGL